VLRQFVDVDGQLTPVQRHDQPEADRHLAGRDHHHDQREDLAVIAAPHP